MGIHKSDSDEIKVSEAAATVISEINESANGAVKSVFIKRKSKQPIKGKKKKRFLNKKKNKITKRQSTPNFHATKSAKSTPIASKKRNFKKKNDAKRRSRPKLNSAS